MITGRVSTIALALALGLVTTASGQVSSPGDTTEVIVKGVVRPKPAPADPLPPLDIFVAPARIEQIALSPDGTHLAFATHVDGEHLLAVYDVTDSSKRAIKLADDEVTAITWADSQHILLSASQTGLRGTCPSGVDQRGADQKNTADLVPMIENRTEGGAASGNGGAKSSAENARVSAMLNALHTPGCAYYGVRSQDALTVVNLKDDQGTRIGNHMSQFTNLALDVPKAVTVDGKTMLIGAYLEMRSYSIDQQPTQRVYLWSVDPETGQGHLVDDGGGDLDRQNNYVDDWLLDTQGQPLARTNYRFTSETFTIQIRDGKRWKPVLTRKIEDREKTFAPFMVGLGRDGRSIVIFDRDPGNGRFHYYELARDGTLSSPLEPDDATRDRPIFHPTTGRLAGFATQGEEPGYVLSDPDLARIYATAQDAAPGQAVRVVSTANDARRMIIFAQGGDDAGAYYYLDLTNGTSIDLGNDHPAVPPEWVATQTATSYTAADGMEIHALLTQPTKAATQPLPLIILPHDGPSGHDARGFAWLAQALASRGYLVLQPNYRGSDGYGRGFLEAGKGEWAGKMLSDIDAGVRALAAQGLADPGRICIVGQGFGGYAALQAAVAESRPYRCAASIGGISDLTEFTTWVRLKRPRIDPDDMGGLEADPNWPRAFRPGTGSMQTLKFYLGPTDLTQNSPVSHAAKAIPVLLIHGIDDQIVPRRQSQLMQRALHDAGRNVEYVELEKCDHSLTTEACKLSTAEAVITFLSKYNPSN